MRIGCHLSSSEGYLAMAKQSAAIGANTFQFFTRNPRGGKAKDIDPKDINAYLKFAGEQGIAHILAHAPYTLNLCSADEKIRRFTKETMTDDLARMEYTPGNAYNFHPGSHVGQGVETGIKFISGMLNEIVKPEQSTFILLETMAGKGSEIGGKFEDLREIIDRLSPEIYPKIGVCLDTCHINDGGYDIVNDLDGVLTEFDRIIGLYRLKAVHINDSMNPFSSHKDRHQKIGEGAIGLEAFRRIVNHPAFKDLPFYLETPNDIDGYAAEIKLLKSLRDDG